MSPRDDVMPDWNVAEGEITNVSRRFFLGAGGATALVLGFGIPARLARGQEAALPPGVNPTVNTFTAFLKLAPDETITFLNPFVEGGQGAFTSVPQLIADEMDVDLAKFIVDTAPPGPEYMLQGGGHFRIVGGSSTIRSTYTIWRQVGATARAMLIQSAAATWQVPKGEITTEPGFCVHLRSHRRASYGSLAVQAAGLTAPMSVTLKGKSQFRYIGKPVKRLDTRDKSTGRAQFGIDTRFDGLFYGAVRSAPLLGAEVDKIGKEAEVRAMPGVHSIHRLPSAVGVVADSFYRAKQAVAALEISWTGGTMPADFSTKERLDALKARFDEKGMSAEEAGDVVGAFKSAAHTIEAVYDAPYLAHATMEPQNSTARFNPDGTLDLWVPNQGPDFFLGLAAKNSGIDPEKIRLHSPLLGGFFGRRSIYGHEPMSQAILLAKASGKPVKVVWTREEDITRDFFRPLAAVKCRAAFDGSNKLTALHVTAPGEGPSRRLSKMLGFSADGVNSSVVEGLTEKPYAIASKRVDYISAPQASNIGFWRSVGHSMNDFFSESFIDEIALHVKQDPYALRLALVGHSPRHVNLLKSVASLAGGWKSGPYAVDGTQRAMGVAMASPFGTEVATIAEISFVNGDIVVHHLFVAVDPGVIVNPAIVKAQIESGCAMGLSQTLFEEITFDKGQVVQSNFDNYRILPPDRMPPIEVAIIESGAPIGGIGEIGVPSVAPAVANALATLTGKRLRSLPLSPEKLKTA